MFDSPRGPAPEEGVLRFLVEELARRPIRAASERALGDYLAGELAKAFPGAAEREVDGAGGRIDFVVGHLGVELKVAGSAADVTRQLWRYADSGRFSRLALVTTVGRHKGIIDAAAFSVPVTIVHLRSL